MFLRSYRAGGDIPLRDGGRLVGLRQFSLLRAGLVPSLQQYVVGVLTPGTHAWHTEAQASEVIVVDQDSTGPGRVMTPADRQGSDRGRV